MTFNTPGTSGNRWAGTINSTNLGATPINSNVSGLQKGDLVTFALVLENTGSSPNGAFDVKVKDDLPAGFIVPAGGLNLRVADGTGTALPFTDLGGGLLGSGIQLDDGPTGALAASSPTSGQNIAVVTYDLRLATTVGAAQTITNTATLFGYGATEGGPTFTSGLTDTATATTGSFVATKSVASTSEAVTTGSGVAIGEVVRYRLQLQVPETGTLADTQIVDNLPTGLAFLNDNTAKAMIVTNLGGITSTGTNQLFGGTLDQTGNGATVAGLTPTFVLPDANVSTSTSSNSDTYGDGTDVYFKLGDLTNSDGDADAEFVVIEFNAIVENVVGNSLGTTLGNTFNGLVSGTQVGATSASAPVTVQAPQLTLAKTTTTPSINAGDDPVVLQARAHQLEQRERDDRVRADAERHASRWSDAQPSVDQHEHHRHGRDADGHIGGQHRLVHDRLSREELDRHRQLHRGCRQHAHPGAGAREHRDLQIDLAGRRERIDRQRTGSDTPGAAGTSTGERTGTGVSPNTLTGTGTVNVTVYSSSLSGTIYTDLNNDSVFNAGDAGIVGKTVTLTGTDHLGNAVNLSTTTTAGGAYSFTNLRGGTYAITKAAAVKALEGLPPSGLRSSGTAAPPAITAITLPTGVSTPAAATTSARSCAPTCPS